MLAERIRHHTEELEISADNTVLKITASLGVSSLIPADEVAIDRIVSLAGSAMYKAKDNGRNQVQCNALV